MAAEPCLARALGALSLATRAERRIAAVKQKAANCVSNPVAKAIRREPLLRLKQCEHQSDGSGNALSPSYPKSGDENRETREIRGRESVWKNFVTHPVSEPHQFSNRFISR